MSPALVAIAINQTPAVIALVRDAWAKRYPGASAPTEEQIMAAYRNAFQASMEKSEAWLEAHPEAPKMASGPREAKDEMTDRT